jgi:hypothetical protein
MGCSWALCSPKTVPRRGGSKLKDLSGSKLKTTPAGIRKSWNMLAAGSYACAACMCMNASRARDSDVIA